jgi:hypothetical protein
VPSAYFTSGETSPDYTATAGGTGSSGRYPWSHGISLPTCRIASNGNRPSKITEVRMYLAGYSTTTTGVLTISPSTGYSGDASFVVAAGSSAANTGYKTINAGFSSSPQTPNISFTANYSVYVGNDSASSDTIQIGSLGTNRRLWGQYKYIQVPVTPTGVTVSADQANQELDVSWNGISDWGDSTTSRGYLVRVSTSSSRDTDGNFTSTLTTADVGYTTTSTSIPIAGNTGKTYYVQVYAYNELSSFSGGPKSVASSTSSVYLGPQAAAPTWTDYMGNTGRVGVSYYGYANASSSTSFDIDVISSNLSTYNLTGQISGSNYIVSGVPTRSGTASITIRATDSYSQTTDFSNSISISAPYTPSWTDLTFKTGTANTSYGSDSITASYATSVSASWSGNSPGLSLNASGDTVTLSGTPNSNAGGTYYISVEATGYTDGATGSTPTRSATASVYINPLPVPEWTDIAINPIAAINKNYSSNVSATNVESYELIGNPSWLSIGSSTGVLSGFPTSSDLTYGLNDAQKSFVVRANGSTEFIEQEFVIDVIHPFKVFKTAEGDFVYPSSQVERYDAILEDFVPVQNIRRWNDVIEDWEDIDLL